MNPEASEARDSVGTATAVPTLRLSGVKKSFGTLMANDNIDLDLMPGEVHAVLGENGAGKSTLMNIVFGALAPDEGTLEVDGVPTPWPTQREAIQRGVGMVHQHFMLLSTFTVAENVLLAVLWTAQGRHYKLKDAVRAVREMGERFDLDLDPNAQSDDLSVGEKLRLEIVKVLLQGELSGGLRVLILDEPTALLTHQEIQDLFQIIRGFASEGTAVAIITHKLQEVMAVSDRVTVLRDGRLIRTMQTSQASPASLAELMVGRELPKRTHVHSVGGDVVLRVSSLTLIEEGSTLLDHIAFEVRSGEIVGIAGVAGNGQDQLAECVTGLRRSTRGEVWLGDRDITAAARDELIQGEIAHIPEDRRASGMVPSASLKHNFVLGIHRWKEFQKRGWLRHDVIDQHGSRLVEQMSVRATGIDQPIGSLSGGNQQRVILGRELHKRAAFILASEPTRGLDVVGTDYIRDVLVEQRDVGAAVLLISLDLDEILALSDRILVMYGGRIVGEVDPRQGDVAQIGLLMGGAKAGTAA